MCRSSSNTCGARKPVAKPVVSAPRHDVGTEPMVHLRVEHEEGIFSVAVGERITTGAVIAVARGSTNEAASR